MILAAAYLVIYTFVVPLPDMVACEREMARIKSEFREDRHMYCVDARPTTPAPNGGVAWYR